MPKTIEGKESRLFVDVARRTVATKVARAPLAESISNAKWLRRAVDDGNTRYPGATTDHGRDHYPCQIASYGSIHSFRAA